MTIEAIKEQLKSSDNPVAKSFHVGEHFKVLIFGFNKGMEMKNHKAYHPTKLLVLEGEIMYHEERNDVRLGKYEEVEIAAEVPHSVAALTDAVVLLTQG